MILRYKEPKEYNFDFSIYEKDTKILTEQIATISDTSKSKQTLFCSKFSPSMLEIENIAVLKNQITEKDIKVAANTQDLKDLWDLYAATSALWSRVHDVFGKAAISQMEKWEAFIQKKLFALQNKDFISYDNHKAVRNYARLVIKACQRVGLGIDVTPKYSARYGKARTGIVE